MGKVGVAIVLVIVVAIIAAGVLYFINSGWQGGTITPSNGSGTSSGTVPTLVLGAPTGTAAGGDATVSDGTITFSRPDDFGLAVTQAQISVHSYIPPCDPDFDYCLYYDGTAYQGTNFDSAGIRIDKRTDLATQSACLTTAPDGYANFTPTSTTSGDYSVSEFTPIGNAGAGHYAVGTLYRLEYNGACYEFETRIGQTQFANYPSGTIQQFTAADQAALQSEIQNILNGITLPSGETIAFPN
jgi:hypothetical protein